MSTRPAEITTPYGWTELFDAIRATHDAIRWLNTRIEHYRDLRAGTEPAEPATTARPTEPAEPATSGAPAEHMEASGPEPGPVAGAAAVDERSAPHRDAPAGDPSAAPVGETGTDTEPEKGSNAMQPDEQQRRDALIHEEHERQQRDLQSDGVLDGDENPEPGDGGTADLDLEG